MPWKRAKKFLNCYKSNEAGLCPASTVAGLPAILFKDQIIQIFVLPVFAHSHPSSVRFSIVCGRRGKMTGRKNKLPLDNMGVPWYYTLCRCSPVWWNGRHWGLKIPCWRQRTGSSPVTGTITVQNKISRRGAVGSSSGS